MVVSGLVVCVRWGGGPSLETSNSIAMTLFIVIGKKKKYFPKSRRVVLWWARVAAECRRVA
jgi:hypothetical protein